MPVRGDVELYSPLEALNKIRVADEGTTECNNVGIALRDRFVSGLLVAAHVAHENAWVYFAYLVEPQRLAEFVKAKARAVHHVQVREVKRHKLQGVIQEGLPEILRAHTIEIAI
jgi:hypothetical protein